MTKEEKTAKEKLEKSQNREVLSVYFNLRNAEDMKLWNKFQKIQKEMHRSNAGAVRQMIREY